MEKYTTFNEEFNQLDPERQERIKIRAAEIELEELTLKRLGEKLGFSSSELAECLEKQKTTVSQLESVQNLELNTLRNVVNALEGTIEIIIRIPHKEPVILSDFPR